MVTIAERPADGPPFGHTKAEYFSSGFEGLLIVGAAVAIIWAAAALREPQPLGNSAGASRCRWRARRSTACWPGHARRLARALDRAGGRRAHLFTDVWTSAGVVVGLLLVPVTGWLWLDPLLAIGVALNILLRRRARPGARSTG
jgi:divalent metal cation (Fe/Co/Zn/Cd) transporter